MRFMQIFFISIVFIFVDALLMLLLLLLLLVEFAPAPVYLDKMSKDVWKKGRRDIKNELKNFRDPFERDVKKGLRETRKSMKRVN